MPKKSAVNVSELIRECLTKNPKSTFAEAKAFVEDHAGTVNKNSLNVAFYAIRKKLNGTAKTRKDATYRPAANNGELHIERLKLAANYLRAVGDIDTALNCVKQVNELQVS